MRLKQLILFCLLMLVGVRTFAYDVQYLDLYYNIKEPDGEFFAEVTSGSGTYKQESIIIPSSISVIYKGSLKNIPVKSIGYNAFYNCSNLKEITIPDGITSIGGQAFWKCSNLENVNIPSSVTSFGMSVFSGCSSLTGTITIPDGVEMIPDDMFLSCSNLEKVIIPETVTHIYAYAFTGCRRLSNVKLPDGLSWLDYDVFWGCEGLTEITIPSKVGSNDGGYWGGRSFENCINLEKVIISDGGTYRTIPNNTFNGCTKLSEIYIPNSVTSIAEYAFYNCSNLKKIDLPCVRHISANAFEKCSSLKFLNIGNHLTFIGSEAFFECSELTEVVFPETEKEVNNSYVEKIKIKNKAFYGCNSLKKIICRTTIVPDCEENVFDETNNVPIIVPTSLLETYKETEGWSNYKDRITDKVSITLNNGGDGTGYATYCSHADLDFSGMSNIQAYIIEKGSYYKTDESYVVPTQVNQMRYGTGILLIGKPGTYEVPFVINDETYDNNLLKGTFEEQALSKAGENGKINYILSKGSKGIGFYKSSGEGNIAAHKAYLPLSEDDAAKINMLLIGGNGNTTGVEQSIHEIMPQTDAIYNLNGQRVENPQHGGIYIIGGKKILY